jgi:hypothetical protein
MSLISDILSYFTKQKGDNLMGTMHPQELLKQWELETIPHEMATGHTLQNLAKMQQTIDAINLSLYNIRADVDSLIAHTGMKPNTKGKKKPPKKG